MVIKAHVIRREIELRGGDTTAVTAQLQEGLESGEYSPHDFSVKQLALALMGDEWVRQLEHPKSGKPVSREVLEAAGDVVALTDFSNITGQIFFNKVKEAYALFATPFADLIPSVPSDIVNTMEKIPGFGDIGDEFTVVGEGSEYPIMGVSEDYHEVPPKRKRGGIVQLTKEAIAGDRTGELLNYCAGLAKWLKINLEKRLIDAFVDENAGAISAAQGGHRYHWRSSTFATYQTSSTAAPYYDNVTASAALVDESDINEAWQTLITITDPYTSERIDQNPTHLVVTSQNVFTGFRILRSTQVRTHAGGYPTTGNPLETVSEPGLKSVTGLQNLQLLTTPRLDDRMATDTDWYLSDPKKHLVRSTIWDITPEEAPMNSRDAFYRDITFAHKISVLDAVGTDDPRFTTEGRA